MTTCKEGKVSGQALILAYVAGGSSVPLFMRYLTFHFDSMTMNFYRMTSGFIVLLLTCMVLNRRALAALLRKRAKLAWIALLSVTLFLPQILIIEGIRFTSAAVGALIMLLGIPLTGIFAFVFFHDERQALRDRRFLAGAILAFAGTLVVTLARHEMNVRYSLGIVCLLAATLLGVVAALLSKRVIRDEHPLSVAVVNSGISSVLFLAGTLAMGHIGRAMEVPGVTVLALVLSGVIGVTSGVAIFFAVVHRFGVITAKIAELAMPVLTGLWAYLFLRETLNVTQIIGGLVIIAGCGLLLMANRSRLPETVVPSEMA